MQPAFFTQGGFAMYPLLLCSVIALAVVLERLYSLWGMEQNLRQFHVGLMDPMERADRSQLLAIARTSKALLAPIVVNLLTSSYKSPRQTEAAAASSRSEVISSLKRYLWVLGTIGASAPFIGLLGTVLGIIKSFHSMATAGTGGFDVVAAGISEALIATAAGLVIAVLSVIAYNYFTVRVNRIATQLSHHLQELLILLPES